jgi:hypothetical protein
VPVEPDKFVKFKLSVDDCHCIDPVFPLKVKSVLFVPVHTVVAPLMAPATDTGSTVMVTLGVFAEAHAPLVTTAR